MNTSTSKTADHKSYHRIWLILIAFCAGFSVMVVELIGIRLLAPWFGNSLYTWTGLIGVIQATEVLKLILGTGKILQGRLLIYEALDMEFETIKVERDPDCPVCGDNPTITALIDYEEFCGVNF